jgi:hypothetical protein
MGIFSQYASKSVPTTADKLLIDDVADITTASGMEKIITIGQLLNMIWGGGTFTGKVIVDVGSGDALVVSSDGTKTSAGAIWLNPASGTAGGINMKNATDGFTYTIIADITGLPATTPAIAGYSGGWVFFSQGSGSGSNPIVAFGNSSSTGPGGANGCALTAWTNSKLESLKSTLDDASGNMTLGGGLATKVRTIVASGAVSATDSLVLLNAATLTATLPTAVGITGRAYTVKLITASTGTVATTSAQTIDGAATYSLPANHKYVTVVSDGANWQITANN